MSNFRYPLLLTLWENQSYNSGSRYLLVGCHSCLMEYWTKSQQKTGEIWGILSGLEKTRRLLVVEVLVSKTLIFGSIYFIKLIHSINFDQQFIDPFTIFVLLHLVFTPRTSINDTQFYNALNRVSSFSPNFFPTNCTIKYSPS